MNTEQVQLVTEVQAAKMLAVSVAALRRWRRERRGPEFTHCERCVRYDIRAIERFLTENSSATRNTAGLRSTAKRMARSVGVATRK
jgi:hypothetical protein